VNCGRPTRICARRQRILPGSDLAILGFGRLGGAARSSAEPALGVGLHLCRDLDRVRLRSLRHRYLRQADRRLASQQDGRCQLSARRPEASASRSAAGPSRWAHPSLRSRFAIRIHQVHQAPCRSRDRALGTATTTLCPRRSTGFTRPR